jgi:hypothetical protein
MAYGDKRDYPKINLYYVGKYKGRNQMNYAGTTTWSKDTKEAVRHFWDNPAHGKYAGYKIVARYAVASKRRRQG